MMRLLLFIFLALGLTACGGRTSMVPQSSASLTVVQGDALPMPQQADWDQAEIPDIYRLGPLDKVRVDVFGVSEFQDMEVQLDTAGRFTFPFVGLVNAQGRTLDEVSAELARGLKDGFLRNPQVTVNLLESNSAVVIVDGQVMQPGAYPAASGMTLLRSLAMARGLTEIAAVDEVVVLRTVNGQRMAGLYDVSQIRAGAYSDPQIYPNDVVIVGDSPQRRLFKDIIGIAPLLTAPIIALVQTSNN